MTLRENLSHSVLDLRTLRCLQTFLNSVLIYRNRIQMPNGHTHLPRKDIDIGIHGRK